MIVTIGNIEKYDEKNEKTLKRLDEENLAINLHKCECGLTKLIWLGYKTNSEGITPTKTHYSNTKIPKH